MQLLIVEADMFDIEKIRELLKTESNTAYFWSGLGVDGATIAADVARNNGGVTLEIIMENNIAKSTLVIIETFL